MGADLTYVLSFDVTPGFADTLKLPLLAGRPFAPADHSDGTAIPVWASYRFWKRELGGAPGVLGRSFQIEDQDTTVTVVGILAPEIRLALGASDRNIFRRNDARGRG